MFDHVYIAANGQCVYQGEGSNIVDYMRMFNLHCPKTYNPADFSRYNIKNIFLIKSCIILVIEVSSGEYGPEFLDKMVEKIGMKSRLFKYYFIL